MNVAKDTSPVPERPSHSGDWAIFAGIVLVAFAVRLVYVLQMRHSPMFAHPIMDELYHDQWAQAFAAGKRFVEGPYFRAPLYPWMLGIVFKVFGHGYLVPRIVQSIIGALSCGVVFLIGRRVFDRRIGVVAGLVAASYWMLIYYDGELLIPTLIVFLDLLLILQLFRAADRPGRFAFGLAGLLLGVSALARPNILLFAPAVVVWLVVMHRRQWRKAATYAVMFGVGCVLPVLPVTSRNYAVGADVVLIASQGGVNFYIGNNAHSDGMTAIVPGTPGDWWGGYYATIAQAEQAAGQKLRPSEVSRYYFGEAWKWMIGDPVGFLKLTARKLHYFWTRWEIPNNKSIYFWTGRFTPILDWLPLGFAVVGTLGLLGLALSFRRAGALFPLWGFVLVYMISVVMFFCTARYRTPVLAPLILLGVWGVFELVTLVRRSGMTGVLAAGVLLVPAALLVNLGGRPGGALPEALSYKSLGQAYSNAGDAEAAADAYRAALEIDPQLLTARYNLATVLAKLGRHEQAIEQYRIAVHTPARQRMGESIDIVAAAYNGLGVSLVESGRLENAVEPFTRSIELTPDAPRANARSNLVSVLVKLGRVADAIAACRDAVAVNPKWAEMQHRLGSLLAGAGEYQDAIGPLREAARLRPDDPAILRDLGRVLAAVGRDDEAVEALSQCLGIDSDDAVARTALSDVFLRLGKFGEAERVLREGLAGGKTVLINQLAWFLATCPDERYRDGAEAVRLARSLCGDNVDCPPAILDTVAAALAEAGRFEEAAEVAQRALAGAHGADWPGSDELEAEIRERLELYRSGQAYRQQGPR